MAFVRVKLIKGNPYLYEITSYRDPDGRVRQRSRYLGKACGETQDAVDFGDRVLVKISINKKLQWVEGIVVPGFTQVPACRWPRLGAGAAEELLTVPYQPPGTVTVAWRSKDREGVTQLPIAQTRLRKRSAAKPSPSLPLPKLPDWLEAHLQWQIEKLQQKKTGSQDPV